MADRYGYLAEPSRKIVRNLWDISHVMDRISDGKGSQRRILIILSEVDSMTQRELTRKLGIQPGSASEVLGKLEATGMIVRTPSETDRRTADVRLTDLGRQKADEADKRREDRQHQMFVCLSEEEQMTFLSILEKLQDDWEERFK